MVQASGSLLLEVFLACPTERRPQKKTQNLQGFSILSGLRDRDVWISLLVLFPPQPNLIQVEKDGRVDSKIIKDRTVKPRVYGALRLNTYGFSCSDQVL